MAKMRIGGDTTGIKRELVSLGREIEGLGKKRKVQIFDKETQEFIEKGAKIAVGQMRQEMEKLQSTNVKISEEMKKQKLSQDQIQQKTLEHIRNKAKILALEKDIQKVQEKSTELLRSPRAIDALVGGAKKGGGGILSRIPGVGRVAGGARAAAGFGMMGLVGGGLAAAALGGGAFALGRGYQGFNEFSGGIEERIALTGRGLGGRQSTGINPEAAGLGMSAGQLRRAQLQAVDIFGSEGATQESVVARARAARGMGISVDQLQAAGSGLRQQLGTGGAQRTFAKLQATLMATELKGAVGPWLETAAAMLTKINENGIGLDSAALHALQTLSQVEGLSPERVMKVMNNLDDTMKSATGENAAFFMSALSSRGIGGGSLGGSQVAMQMGLFGGDLSKIRERGLLSPKDMKAMEDMRIAVDPGDNGQGGRDAFAERVKGITSMFDRITDGMGVAGKMLTAQKITGISNPVEALEAIEMARRAGQTADPRERQKIIDKMQDKMKTPQEKMVDRLDTIAKSTAGQLQVSQAFKQQNLEILGEKVAPIAVSINEHLANIDKFLANILSFFEINTVSEEQEQQARAGTLSVDEFKAETPERRKKLEAAIREEYSDSYNRVEEMKKTGGSYYSGRNPKLEKEKDHLEKLAGLLNQLIRLQGDALKQMKKPTNTNVSGREHN